MQESLSFASKTVLTVSELTQNIKGLLEGQFGSVWVSGEISNFHAHSSGHYYFTLKDSKAAISSVMFRGANRLLKFRVEDGMEVIAQGRVSVYEVRGNYQFILETMEPKGIGALALAFQQLRDKLLEEGLFHEARKRPLPFLPKTVGIVTSPTGSVIRDMIHILKRRWPAVNILLYAVNVQGEAAAPDVVRGIEAINRHGEAEMLIVGRGGGSIEDLWAFNTEAVARAIFASAIPVVSAVGHETDVTIADFVADLRAPTPSAAAELAVPVYRDLLETLREHRRQILRLTQNALDSKRESLKYWASHLQHRHPKARLQEMAQRIDDLRSRLTTKLEGLLQERRFEWLRLSEKLSALSPLAVLSRGYSIVRKLEENSNLGPVVKDSEQCSPGDQLQIQLRKGTLKAQVL